MLEISEEVKNLYRNGTNSKSLILQFSELDLSITNEKIYYESMEITESISEEDELIFGDCNSAEFKVLVADIEDDLTGLSFIVTQTLNNNPNYVMPLGTYKVKSCRRQSDRRFKEIIAYDDMLKLDRDVTAWYNSRAFPVTLKSLRESLLIYCGIGYEEQDLTNDEVLINKTIRPSSMNGRDVMKRICELNGGFGHITRQNKFKVVTLVGLGLYPSETLYPSEDLFPAEAGEIIDGVSSGASYYPESTYEDYICRAIDQIKIRTNEDDGGIVVNNGKTGTNEYIIQGNFLISDKSKEELTEIAEALFLVIKNKYYRPHNMIVTGLPYLEVGDSILIATRDDVIESFIFSRTLTGIQALKDTLGATGYEYRQNKVGLDVQISQLELVQSDLQDKAEELKETTTELEETTEGMGQEIEEIQKFNGETIVNLQKLDESIVAEVKRAMSAEETLSSSLKITEDAISAEVKRATKAEGELSSSINMTAESIQSEVKRATKEDENLLSKIIQTAESIESEISRATKAEDTLSSKITQTSESIQSEVNRATKAEGELSSKITQTSEQITSEVTRAKSAESSLSSRIIQTADQLTTEVRRASAAENNLSSRITQTAEQISSKVSKGEVVSEINQSAEQIVVRAMKLLIDTEAFYFDGVNAEYRGDIVCIGTDSNRTTYKVTISPNVSDITCEIIESDGTTYSAFLNGAHFNMALNGERNITINAAGSITCKKLNGYTPIHSGNIANYSCSYAAEAYFAEYADKTYNETSNEHTSNCFITSTGRIYKVPSGSSKRFKTDVSSELNKELDPHKLYELPVVQFKYKPTFYGLPEDTEMPTVIGIIAEDVEEIYPCATEKEEDTGEVNNWNIRYLVPPMLALIQEQKKEIDVLKSELAKLKNLLREKGVL